MGLGSRRGLTLIEVLASIVILSVGSIFVTQGLVRASQAEAVAEEQASAYFFAVSKMAELELAAQTGHEIEDSQEGKFRVGTQTFQWQVSALAPVAEDPLLKRITLTVAWESRGRQSMRRVDTLLRPLKPHDTPS